MLELTVEHNLDDVLESMEEVAHRLSDFRPFFREWRTEWLASREEMYQSYGSSTGTPWPMYSRQTGEHRYSAVKASILGHRMTHDDLLRWAGGREELYPSLTTDSSPLSIYEENANQAEVGTAHQSAAEIDQGAGYMPMWAGGYRIPQRRILAWGSGLTQATQELTEAFTQAAMDALDEAGASRASFDDIQVLMRG